MLVKMMNRKDPGIKNGQQSKTLLVKNSLLSMVIFQHASACNFFVALSLLSGTTGFSEMNLSNVSKKRPFPI